MGTTATPLFIDDDVPPRGENLLLPDDNAIAPGRGDPGFFGTLPPDDDEEEEEDNDSGDEDNNDVDSLISGLPK